jgi:hypothetical protein
LQELPRSTGNCRQFHGAIVRVVAGWPANAAAAGTAIALTVAAQGVPAVTKCANNNRNSGQAEEQQLATL